MEEEFTILPFPVLPLALQQPGDRKCQENTWNLLLERLSRSKVQIIKHPIGDGTRTTFTFDLPFKEVISWRIVSPLHGVVQPDCQLTADKLTVIFGVAPSVEEFEIEILGIRH